VDQLGKVVYALYYTGGREESRVRKVGGGNWRGTVLGERGNRSKRKKKHTPRTQATILLARPNEGEERAHCVRSITTWHKVIFGLITLSTQYWNSWYAQHYFWNPIENL
jgi:hypothetical protein